MKKLLLAPLALLALTVGARADVIYTVYQDASEAVTDVQFSLPGFASSVAEDPADVTGTYASTFDGPLLFAYTSVGGSVGQIGPAADANPPYGITNDVIQLDSQMTSPADGTYSSVLLRIGGNAVDRVGVLVIAGAPASVPEPNPVAVLALGLTALGIAAVRRGNAGSTP